MLLCGASLAQNGSPDPVVAKFSIADWLKNGEHSAIRWTPQISPARLSSHQRLIVQMGIQLDGEELYNRPGKSRVVMLLQLTDAQGGVWQNHGTIDLDKVKEGVRSEYLDYIFSAFVLPGEYRVALALVDTVTGEHAVREERLHVAPIKNDVLPDAWRGLPPVEFLSPADPPDTWYLPSVGEPLHLPVNTRRPVRIDMLVNLTPSERATGSVGPQSGNLRVLLPALKTFSQLDLHTGTLNVALLDLMHQKVAFHQDDLHSLDWPAMKNAIGEQTAGTIDIKSLEDRSRSAVFFVSQVRHKIGAGEGQAHALIVLSSAVEFESGEDLQPIDASPSPDCRVFYIRFPSALPRPEHRPGPVGYGHHGHMGGGGGQGDWRRGGGQREELQIDQLEHTLKPVAPRVFDVKSPEDFRKALADILAEISKL